MNLIIPHNFEPRHYQVDLYNFIANGYRRAMILMHRRAGKDKTCINIMCKESMKKVGIYYYLLPTIKQAKKVMWDNSEMMQHIPDEIIKGNPNKSELKIELVNGSIIQFLGGDNYDSIRGTNPIGIICSEWAFMNPMIWDEVVQPILRENNGWIIFITTPNGENHAYDMYDMAVQNPAWYSELLTIEDTGVVSQSDIDEDRRSGKTEQMIQQEYYCSFKAGTVGSYYFDLIARVHDEGRAVSGKYDPSLPVWVALDIGVSDSTSIWFAQITKEKKIILLDTFEDNGKFAPFYIKYIKEWLSKRDAKLAKVIIPHDSKKQDFTSGKTAEQAFINGFSGIHVKYLNIESIKIGIQRVREHFPNCHFSTECKTGIRTLGQYVKEFDKKKKLYKDIPFHDWASHCADAFRYLISGIEYSNFSEKAIPQATSKAETRETSNIMERKF